MSECVGCSFRGACPAFCLLVCAVSPHPHLQDGGTENVGLRLREQVWSRPVVQAWPRPPVCQHPGDMAGALDATHLAGRELC